VSLLVAKPILQHLRMSAMGGKRTFLRKNAGVLKQ
jgi:hypothetical protein